MRHEGTSRDMALRAVLPSLSFLIVVALMLAVAAPVEAASPMPSFVGGGDTRSEGEGAGLVGSPFLAAAGVIGLGMLVAGATLLWLRVTRDE